MSDEFIAALPGHPLSEFGAGVRPVHPIRVDYSRAAVWSLLERSRNRSAGRAHYLGRELLKPLFLEVGLNRSIHSQPRRPPGRPDKRAGAAVRVVNRLAGTDHRVALALG